MHVSRQASESRYTNNIFDHHTQGIEAEERIDDNDDVRLLIKYSDRQVVSELATKYAKNGQLHVDLPTMNLVSLTTPEKNLSKIRSLPGIINVEIDHTYSMEDENNDDIDIDIDMDYEYEYEDYEYDDGTRRRRLEESVPYGIAMVQADQLSLPDVDVGSNSTSSIIKICVADAGYDLGHEDLPNNETHNVLGYVAEEFLVDEEGGITSPFGNYTHGTHVAGTIAAIGNNDIGVSSILNDPTKFQLLIAKVFHGGDGGVTTSESTILAGINWCVENGAKIINLSLSTDEYSESFRDVFEDLYLNKDILFVASAGNTGDTTPRYPGYFPHVMAVTAVDETGMYYNVSSYHDQVEIAAPGVNILSTTPNNTYGLASSTSTAVPHVTGVAALIWSFFPECTNHQIRNVLLRTALKQSTAGSTNETEAIAECNPFYGEGIVQALDAYNLLNDAKNVSSTTFCDDVGGLPRGVNGGCYQLAPTPSPTLSLQPTSSPVPSTSPTTSMQPSTSQSPTETPIVPLNHHCIFVLAGQSNAGGYANLNHLLTLATEDIEKSGSDSNSTEFGIYRTLDNTEWTQRDDVFVSFPNELGARNIRWFEDWLRADKFGSDETRFGTEVGFGFEMGDVFCDKVAIAKAAGVGSLAVEWRPPSSGDVGEYYPQMIENVIDFQNRMVEEVDDVGKLPLPPKVCGFMWMHGYADIYVPEFLAEYEVNLENLIADVRNDFGDPDLPVLIVEIGGRGVNTTEEEELELREIQERVANNDGNRTLFSRTAPFNTGFEYWSETETFDAEYHYFGRADVIERIGRNMARDMLSLLPDEEVLATCGSIQNTSTPTMSPTLLPTQTPSTSPQPSVFPSFLPIVIATEQPTPLITSLPNSDPVVPSTTPAKSGANLHVLPHDVVGVLTGLFMLASVLWT